MYAAVQGRRISVACFTVVASLSAVAQDTAPASFTASPGVYKILAEDENFRVLVATWQPGQRDEWHSHPAAAVYSISGCDEQRIHMPGGKYVDAKSAKGRVSLNKAVVSHSFENRSAKQCQTLIVERK